MNNSPFRLLQNLWRIHWENLALYLFTFGTDITRKSYVSLASHLLTVRGLHKGLTHRVYILYNILEGWVRPKLSE